MGDTGTDEPIENDTAELNSRQIDAARMLAMEPDRTKESVAASLKISRRTIFRWLSDARFQKKIEEFRRSKMVANDARSVIRMLSAKEKRDLLSLLLEEKENRHLNLREIEQLEKEIMGIAESDHDPLRETTKGAVEKVELLVGRLRKNALFDRDYESDGRHKKLTLRDLIDGLIEISLISIGLGVDTKDAQATLKVCRQIMREMGEEENGDRDRERTDEYDDYDEERQGNDLGDEAYDLDDSTDEWEYNE